MCESYVQAYSKPCCSASCINSIIRWYGGSGRTVTPKLSMEPPLSLAGERAYRREMARNSGLGVSPVCIRGRRRVAVSGGRERPPCRVGAQSGAGGVRLVSDRDHCAGGRFGARLQTVALVGETR